MRLKALAQACHPGPSLVVTTVAVLLGVGVGYPAGRLVLLGAVMLADQLSVGWSNDWIDAPRDLAVSRRDKPIATGAITARSVGIAAFAALAVALLLTIPLGPAALVAHAIALGSAWAYNAWLKRTLVSIVPYVVSFGILPAIVTLGLPGPRWPAWWVVVAGCLFGAAAHVTNVLPDLELDRVTGVRGLAHVMGARAGGLVSFGILAVTAAVIALGATVGGGLTGWPSAVVVTAAAITVLIALLGVVLALRGVRSRLLMQLIMGSAVLDVIGLVAAGPVLSGSPL